MAAELVGRGSNRLAAIVFAGFREKFAVGEFDRRACLLGARVENVVNLHFTGQHPALDHGRRELARLVELVIDEVPVASATSLTRS